MIFHGTLFKIIDLVTASCRDISHIGIPITTSLQ